MATKKENRLIYTGGVQGHEDLQYRFEFDENKMKYQLVFLREKTFAEETETPSTISIPSKDVEIEIKREEGVTDPGWKQTIDSMILARGEGFIKHTKKVIKIMKSETKQVMVKSTTNVTKWKPVRTLDVYCNLLPNQVNEFINNYLTHKTI